MQVNSQAPAMSYAHIHPGSPGSDARRHTSCATSGESCSEFSGTSTIRIDQAAIRRIARHDRDWQRASVGHKKIMMRIEMVMPVLSSKRHPNFGHRSQQKNTNEGPQKWQSGAGSWTMHQQRS